MPLRVVQFTCTDTGDLAPYVAGDPPIWRFGYFFWRWGNFNGELQYIRFEKQAFWVPNDAVDGFGFNLVPDIVAKFVPFYSKIGELPFQILSNPIGLLTGDVSGLGTLQSDGSFGSAPTVTKYADNAISWD